MFVFADVQGQGGWKIFILAVILYIFYPYGFQFSYEFIYPARFIFLPKFPNHYFRNSYKISYRDGLQYADTPI